MVRWGSLRGSVLGIEAALPDGTLLDTLSCPPVTRNPTPETRANVARMIQSRPDSGFFLQLKVLQILQSVPSSLGSGRAWELGFSVQRLGFSVLVWGLGFEVWGLGSGVLDVRVSEVERYGFMGWR